MFSGRHSRSATLDRSAFFWIHAPAAQSTRWGLFMRKIVTLLSAICFALVCTPALARPHYPMKPPEYRKMISGRVEAVWTRIEKKLEVHNVSAERVKEIRRTFDTASREIWVAVDHATADGTVTREEALRVGALTSGLRGKVRGRLASEKKAGSKPVAPAPRESVQNPAPKTPAAKPAPKKTAPAAQPKPAPAPKPAAKPKKPAQSRARGASDYQGD